MSALVGWWWAIVGAGSGPSLVLVMGHCWHWWGVVLTIIGVDWGWWWVLTTSYVTRCCCEQLSLHVQSSSCHCCVLVTCPCSVVVVSYHHSAVVIVCYCPSSLSIAVVSSPAFVVVVLCHCSCCVVLCHHLLVGQVSWVGIRVLTNGQWTTNNKSVVV